ncbi:MAG: SsrA-binding protein SmpB [Thermoanaerobaculia bacterium]
MKSRIERNEKRTSDRNADKNAGVRPIATNRRALHDYFIEDKLEAGLALTGTEVKSLRDGQANLTDGYVAIDGTEVWLWNVHIAPYGAGSYNNPDSKRRRKLLLHRREITRLAARIQKSGATCVPLSLYFKGKHVKAQIAVVTGKKQYDKRETIKKREIDRETRSAVKTYKR